jgi:hypothetical protein
MMELAKQIGRAMLGTMRNQWQPQQSATPMVRFRQPPAPVQPQVPARPLVGTPRQPMGQSTSSRPLVGAPRLQQQATVNALRAPVPTV